MRRFARVLLLVVLSGVGGAVAAVPAAAASGAASAPAVRYAAGKVTFVGLSSFTIQTGARQTGMIGALTAAADQITAKDYPYVWGGGHSAAGVPSVGIGQRPGRPEQIGYDCSGAVAAVLAGAGLWPARTAVPNDAGVIDYLLRRRLIAPGPASSPDGVTLYDHPGIHIFMNINGRFWGTSDGQNGADPAGGAGWLSDAAIDAHSKKFLEYHFLPGVLARGGPGVPRGAGPGQDYTFQFATDPLLGFGLLPGDAVRVGYRPSGIGTMNATAITYAGERTATGTLVAAGAGGSSLTLMSADGTTTTYGTGGDLTLMRQLALGDVVSVAYTQTPMPTAEDMSPVSLLPTPTQVGAFIASAGNAQWVTEAHSVQVSAPAGAGVASGTVTAVGADRSSLTLQTASGAEQLFSTAGLALAGVRVGATVTVDFAQAAGGVAVAELVRSGAAPS